MRQLETAPPDIRMIRLQEAQLALDSHGGPRLGHDLTVYLHLTREDQRACALARSGQPALDDQRIES